MKKTIHTTVVCFALGLAACAGEISEPTVPLTPAADIFDPANTASSSQGLQAAPADPLDPASLPPDRPTNINGKRPSRYGIETDTWQACISKTTAACSTGSGGLGATCGPGALCNTDFLCVAGVCKRPGGVGEACLANGECTTTPVPLVCVNSLCNARSFLLGPCDEPADCQLPAGNPGPAICVANVCRTPGDLGAPCQTALHCKPSTPAGLPMMCSIPAGQAVGTCAVNSGVGGPCTDETHCNQSTAPRCIPTTDPPATAHVCNQPGGDGAFCDDKPDCNQATSATGRECVAGRCRVAGYQGMPCSQNSQCIVGLACIAGACNPLSAPGGTCDEVGDCTQSQQTRCVSNVCRVTGVLNGPCGQPNNFCSSNPSCVFAGNAAGTMYCINDTCVCPSLDTCTDNSQCAPTSGGQPQVCVPRIAPAQGKFCRPAGTTPTGCCDEKADCRPLGASTCLMNPASLGCNSGGVCTAGLPQMAVCSRDDECSGVLVCRINTNIPGRNYKTCEYPL